MSLYRVIKRRTLLWGAALAALIAPHRAGAAIIGGGAIGDPLAALGPWLDTLIPADESPAATTLGVAAALGAETGVFPGAQQTLEAGCRWLDDEARRRGGGNFATLGEDARAAIAAVAAAAAPGTETRRFFDYSWDRAIFHYYAHPASWASLGYRGPPQPLGFPDADRKP